MHTRSHTSTRSDIVNWRRRIGGEYREMPDLMLTVPQAARLWGLETTTAERVLDDLCRHRLLTRTPGGSYRLAPLH